MARSQAIRKVSDQDQPVTEIGDRPTRTHERQHGLDQANRVIIEELQRDGRRPYGAIAEDRRPVRGGGSPDASSAYVRPASSRSWRSQTHYSSASGDRR